MRITRRRLLQHSVVAAAGLSAAALLAACGGGGTAAPTTAPSAATAATGGVTPTAAPAATTAPQASGPVKLTFYSGGDTNVHDLWANDLLPLYKKSNPNVDFDLVFSEHGTSDQATLDKIAAAKQAGKSSGIDIWEQDSLLQTGGDAGLIEKLDQTKVPNLARAPADVVARRGGYGLPYRGSSVVLAYNSKQVANPPKTLDDLIAWVKANAGQFTYNTPDTGGSGGNFVTRVLMAGIPEADLKIFQTSYDPAKEVEWEKGWSILKDIHPSVYNKGFYPKGNVGTLQLLGKGSINVAPVWSDMGLSYLAQKLLPPEVKLMQIDPPFAGGASYLGVIADSTHKDADFAFLNWVLTPEPQTIIVNKMNGYPGLDWKYMPADVQTKFADIAKSYSFGFSSKYDNDRNQQWYEKVAGMPMPKKQ